MSDTPRVGDATGVWAALVLLVVKVFIEPVREGRIKDVRIPLGLRAIVVVGTVAYGVSIGLVVFAGPIRSLFELFAQDISGVPPIPRFSVGIVFALSAFALVLGQSGALHARAWVRWVITAYTVLILLFVGAIDFVGAQLGLIVSVVAAIGLVALVAFRGHRRFVWWEFVVIAVLIFGSFGTTALFVSARAAATSFDFIPLMVATVLGTLGTLAAPLTIASGAAVAELAVSIATWVAGAFRDKTGRVALTVVLVIIAAWRVLDLVPAVVEIADDFDFAIVRVLGSALLIALIAGAWVVLARIRRDRSAPTISGLIGGLSKTSLLIAAFLTLMVPIGVLNTIAGVIPVLGAPVEVSAVLSLVASTMGTTIAVISLRVLVGLVVVVIAIVLALRGRPALPELLVAIGLPLVLGGVNVLVGGYILWDEASLALVTTVAAFALLVWTLARREATINRLAGVASTLLIAGLFAHSDFLADPVGAALGASAAIAAVLIGLIWSMLTGNGSANDDSTHYPRPSRVMLLLGNALLASTMLAYVSLTRVTEASFDVGQFADLGLRTFGLPLAVCALLAAATTTLRGKRLT